jgi:hypothetical protein
VGFTSRDRVTEDSAWNELNDIQQPHCFNSVQLSYPITQLMKEKISSTIQKCSSESDTTTPSAKIRYTRRMSRRNSIGFTSFCPLVIVSKQKLRLVFDTVITRLQVNRSYLTRSRYGYPCRKTYVHEPDKNPKVRIFEGVTFQGESEESMSQGLGVSRKTRTHAIEQFVRTNSAHWPALSGQ